MPEVWKQHTNEIVFSHVLGIANHYNNALSDSYNTSTDSTNNATYIFNKEPVNVHIISLWFIQYSSFPSALRSFLNAKLKNDEMKSHS